MKFAGRFSIVTCTLLAIALQLCSTIVASKNPPKENPITHLFLVHEPSIEVLRDGLVEVRCETLRPCSGGEAFLGIFPDSAELKYPIYCASGEVAFPDPMHPVARFNLKRLEDPETDINHLREKGGGRAALRLELQGTRLHIFDRIVAYRHANDGGYRRAPALVEGPFVDAVTDSSAIISCEFDLPVTGKLMIGPRPMTFEFAAAEGHAEIAVRGLKADSPCTYQVIWTDASDRFISPEYTFCTAPKRGSNRSFRFAVFCDSRGAYGGGETYVEGVNQATLKALLNIAYAQKASFILFPGDLISGSTSSPVEVERQFQSWKRAASAVGSRVPIYEGVGNHDQPSLWLAGGSSQDYLARPGPEVGEVLFARHFVNPTNGPDPVETDFPPYKENVYSFDWGSAHFTMLNNNYFQKGSGEKVADMAGQLQGAMRQEQLDWLEQDLQSARDRGQKQLFVLAHEPAFPNGGHVKDGMWWNGKRAEIIAIRDHFWRILCRYQVTAAFFGDEHNYSRTLIDSTVNSAFDCPVWQIISGGAGAPFYSRDSSVPWADAVKAFYPLPHLCLLDMNGEDVWLTVLSEHGTVIERVNLSLAQR